MNHESKKKLADQVEFEKLQKKVDRMRQLVPTLGFIKAWFQILKTSESNIAAFETLNNEYFELFGTYRYNCYETFKAIKNRHLKNQK